MRAVAAVRKRRDFPQVSLQLVPARRPGEGHLVYSHRATAVPVQNEPCRSSGGQLPAVRRADGEIPQSVELLDSFAPGLNDDLLPPCQEADDRQLELRKDPHLVAVQQVLVSVRGKGGMLPRAVG